MEDRQLFETMAGQFFEIGDVQLCEMGVEWLS